MNFQEVGQEHRAVVVNCTDQPHMHNLSRRFLMFASTVITSLNYRQLTRLSAVTALAAQQSQHSVTLSDYQGYTKGPFTAFMAPYNKKSLVAGTDYTESFALDPANFPANSLISWNWPAARSKDPVRGFLAVDYGNYYNTSPETPIKSSKVRNITTLNCMINFLADGNKSGFNVIINFFLTSRPGFESILYEIEVFLHLPNYAKDYADSVSSVGTFTSASGLTWKVSKDPSAVHGPDILFYPVIQADVLVGTIDLKEMLSWLSSLGMITGNEFFNGLAVGVEPQQHNGTLSVNVLSVDYLASMDRHP